MSQRYTFRMQLKSGNVAEYKKRHTEIWPALSDLLRASGISDYSIHHDPETGALFAMLTRADNHTMDALSDDPIIKKWWAFMADLMETHETNEPVVIDLEPVFYLP